MKSPVRSRPGRPRSGAAAGAAAYGAELGAVQVGAGELACHRAQYARHRLRGGGGRAPPVTGQLDAPYGDWVFGSQLVDGAMQAVGLTRKQLPARLFCPQIVTDTGAKLSKSLIRDESTDLPSDVALWMLDTRLWPGSLAEYAEQLLGAAEVLLSDPRHFFRAHSAGELNRLLTAPQPRSVPAQ